ncbi:hypothetical protein G7054_g12061 [Neopestalotiopsis clavispora]|nr:hypothetical protein G7054_g12061 [Neopestalotiopsis clavispora]
MFYKPGETSHGLPHDPFKVASCSQSVRGTAADRMDINRLGRRRAQPGALQPVQQPELRPATSHVQRQPDAAQRPQGHGQQRRGHGRLLLAAGHARPARGRQRHLGGVPAAVDEFARAGLAKAWSRALRTPVPMVAASPVRFECEYVQTVRIPGNPPMGTVDVVIGRVVGVHVDEGVLTDGKIDVRKTRPIARLGYYEYGVIDDTFEMIIPGDRAGLYGLEGNAAANRQEDANQKQAETK